MKMIITVILFVAISNVYGQDITAITKYRASVYDVFGDQVDTIAANSEVTILVIPKSKSKNKNKVKVAYTKEGEAYGGFIFKHRLEPGILENLEIPYFNNNPISNVPYRKKEVIKKTHVEIGMYTSEVRDILGSPNSIQDTQFDGWTTSTWFYDNKMIIFRDSKVATISDL